MQDKPLTVKQEAFCKWLYTPGSEVFGNATEAARKAGYKGSTGTLQVVGAQNITKPMIVKEKARIQAVSREKWEWNRDIAIKELNASLFHLTRRVDDGDVGAITARTAVLRELNEISGLHKQQPISIVTQVNHSTVQTEAEVLRKRLDLIERMDKQPTGIERN